MPVLFRSRRLPAAGAALALAASFLVVAATPGAAVVTHPPLTVSKTTAHSGTDHGDSIDESGDSCVGESVTQVTMYLATGVVGDDQPIDTDLTAFGFSAAPDVSGHWSGTFSVQGGGIGALPAGQYTLRTVCFDGIEQSFIYAGVVITINGDAEDTTTTTGDPGTTTTTVAGATSTTASTSTTAATPTTATPAAAVAAQATFTG